MTNLLCKALILQGKKWYWSLLGVKGINGIYTGITWLACGGRRKGRGEKRKGRGDMRRKESSPPPPHTHTLHFCACHAGYIWPPHLSCLMIQTLSGACNRLLVFIYYSFTLLHNDNGYFRHAVLSPRCFDERFSMVPQQVLHHPMQCRPAHYLHEYPQI